MKACKNVLETSTSHSYAVDVKMLQKCFILHVTTSYLDQRVINMFYIKHLQNTLEGGYM